ncbi:MAG: type II toxin-antitoxin system VapC family toxin [Dermatophilus congolensis]|nr:type II toxin-antitoxin system VapC family toxin [Dermatophilus congolensis]
MTTWYLDTSAALKLLLEEAESAALAAAIDAEAPTLASCLLLETECRRAAHRAPGITQQSVSSLLARVDVYEVTPALYREAGLLPGATLRSLDAIHLAACIRIGADALVTYDHRTADAARDLGISVHAPA